MNFKANDIGEIVDYVCTYTYKFVDDVIQRSIHSCINIFVQLIEESIGQCTYSHYLEINLIKS